MHFSIGLHSFLYGFKLIWRPGIKRFVFWPLFINGVLFAAIFFVANHFMSQANAWIMDLLPTWLHWLTSIFWILFLVCFLLMATYTYVALANVIAAPFNGLLAEKIISQLTGQSLPDLSLLDNIKDIPRICGRQLSIIGYYLPRAVLIGILFFVPIVQLIVPPLWFLFNAWLVGLQYIDYPTDVQRIPLVTVRRQLKNKPWPNLSFGMLVMLGSMVPILNLLVMPAAVAGATALWLRVYQEGDLQKKL